MFLCNLMIPVIMIGVGYMMYKHPPKSINAIYGYRTARSMKMMRLGNLPMIAVEDSGLSWDSFCLFPP